ncbi:Hypothetical protein A7982_01011 [Minicystis rosea]|nr:Hypothetical protein A7982_01011 [Minicystis rosea]
MALGCALALSTLAACEPRAVDVGPRVTAPVTAQSIAARDEWIGESPRPAPPPESPPAAVDEGPGHDFAAEARLLYRIAACGSDDPLPPEIDAATVKAHCAEVRPRIEAYKKHHVAVARPFLSALAPANLSEKVVYPFGGGDLMTALTTYPSAREITTLSLELVGDPRRIHGMSQDSLEQSLKLFRAELGELIGALDFSRSETLKKTQRGDIPGELGLFLVGLAIHGYEPVSLRYFTLVPDGSIHYLTEREIIESDHVLAQNRKATWTPPDFSESFANAEIAFRPIGAPASEPVRIHRHLAQNLSNDPLAANPAVLRHLDRKGTVAAMTKAASYLLWNDGFSTIREYLLGHMAFMISDSTGIPPSFAGEAGFVQETYGRFSGSLLRQSPAYNRDFKKLWGGQPHRKLGFTYGYLSGRQAHLLVTKKRSAPATQ